MKIKVFVVNLDRKIRDVVTKIVLAWEEKYDYEKHKMDAFLAFNKKRIVIFLTMFIAVAPVLRFFSGEVQSAMILFCTNVVFAALVIHLDTAMTEDRKRNGDMLRQLGKSPEEARVVNEVTRMVFEKTRKDRLAMTGASMGIVWGICFLVLAFLPNDPASLVQWFALMMNVVAENLARYIFYVEDAIPPKKKKDVKHSITEVVMAAWRALIGQPATAV